MLTGKRWLKTVFTVEQKTVTPILNFRFWKCHYCGSKYTTHDTNNHRFGRSRDGKRYGKTCASLMEPKKITPIFVRLFPRRKARGKGGPVTRHVTRFF